MLACTESNSGNNYTKITTTLRGTNQTPPNILGPHYRWALFFALFIRFYFRFPSAFRLKGWSIFDEFSIKDDPLAFQWICTLLWGSSTGRVFNWFSLSSFNVKHLEEWNCFDPCERYSNSNREGLNLQYIWVMSAETNRRGHFPLVTHRNPGTWSAKIFYIIY